jgi:DNA (cytosine-5)-methyltransferase 1
LAAYYNEIDPYAAQWLRNLIAAGHIAPGDVDERSIEDVRPIDLLGYTQCHFFAGIGVWSHALRRAGWPDERPVWTGSCPCQPFSAAGKGGGFDDERHLWPAWEWLIRHAKPRSVPVFGEQVASKPGLAWLDVVHADLERQGYTVGAVDLCAAGVGAPHIRQRLYFVAYAGCHSSESGRSDGERTQGRDEGEAQKRQRIRVKHPTGGAVSGWPTPLVNDERGSTHCYGPKRTDGGERKKQLKLPGAVNLVNWPTPKAQDGERGGGR